MNNPLYLLVFSFLLFYASKLKAQQLDTEVFKTEFVDTVYSKVLDEDRIVWVKLPEGYRPDNDLHYPVVYLLDGVSLKSNLETVYENYWGHFLPQMILVGISNRQNRTRDLTTSKVTVRRGGRMNMETGGADNFTSFLKNELIPHIDKKYPTSPYRTLIGHSYAGLFTINVLVNHQQLFNNYIAIDPSLDWDDQLLLKEAKKKLKSESYAGRALFVSLAAEQVHMSDGGVNIDNVMDDDSEFSLFARSIIEFSNYVESIKENGLHFSWKVYPEDLHGTVTLPSMIDGLVSLFEWFQFKSPQIYNNPETTVETIKQLLQNQEEIYSKNFGYKSPPMVEEMLIGYGYMNMQMGQPDKAELFLKLGIEHFPKSANAFDSLAEFYQSQGDNVLALKYARKAFQISGTDYHKERVEDLSKQ